MVKSACVGSNPRRAKWLCAMTNRHLRLFIGFGQGMAWT